jgi:hypothetical protein
MKPEVKEKWVEALRSGDYTQAKGKLTKTDPDGEPVGYCCLGVLCDLALLDGVDLDIEAKTVEYLNDPASKMHFLTYNAYSDMQPEEVNVWAGLSRGGDTVEDPTRPGIFISSATAAEVLAGLNDNGSTFEEIADIIEKTF